MHGQTHLHSEASSFPMPHCALEARGLIFLIPRSRHGRSRCLSVHLKQSRSGCLSVRSRKDRSTCLTPHSESFPDEYRLVLQYVARTSMRLWVSRWLTPCMVVAAWDSSSCGIYVDPGPSSGKRPSFADEFYKDRSLACTEEPVRRASRIFDRVFDPFQSLL